MSAVRPQIGRGILASLASWAQLSALRHRGQKKTQGGSWPGHRPSPPLWSHLPNHHPDTELPELLGALADFLLSPQHPVCKAGISILIEQTTKSGSEPWPGYCPHRWLDAWDSGLLLSGAWRVGPRHPTAQTGFGDRVSVHLQASPELSGLATAFCSGRAFLHSHLLSVCLPVSSKK